MYFFVDGDYNYQLSGIEHAQINRVKALRLGGYESKIITLSYNRFLSSISHTLALNPKDWINMYDFFQAGGINQQDLDLTDKITLKDLIAEDEYVENRQGQRLVVYEKESHKKTIYLMADNEDIDRVEYFDQFSNLIKTDYYDVRGFLSMTDIYGQQGGVAREINYDQSGQPVLESFYRYDNQGNLIICWLLKYQQGEYLFSDKSDLEAFFLDQLNQSYTGQNLFISDRAYRTDAGLLAMKTDRDLYIYWHNVFVPAGGKANVTKPFDTLLNEVNQRNQITALLAATKKEVADLKIATNNQIAVFQLPSFVANTSNLPVTAQASYDLITVARIFPEKRLILGVEIFAKVHRLLPKIHWDIFGYAEPEYLDKVEQIIQAKGLADWIHLHSYQQNLAGVYQGAKVFWLTSEFEGFNMAQAEAQVYGVPTIAFDIDYGPAELIRDNENGFLIKNNDIHNFVQKTVTLLTNAEKRLAFSNQAKKTKDLYSWQSMLSAWTAMSKGEG